MTKKKTTERHGFKIGEFVVYRARGPSRVDRGAGGNRHQAGTACYQFRQGQNEASHSDRQDCIGGIRKLADGSLIKRALDTLQARARLKRIVWSRWVQQNIAKLNSGDIISPIAHRVMA